MAKPIVCPQDCQNNHNEHRITMTEIKSDLKYIKEKLDSNSEMIQSVIEGKADKTEVEAINNKLWGFIIFIATLLLSVAGYLFVKWMENHK